MSSPSPSPVLQLDAVTRRYGSLVAVDSVSLTVEPGARQAVIGPNGAGKSTLFNMIAGSVQASSGTIRFDDMDVTQWHEGRRARNGLARTFQHSNLCHSLSALENVGLAAQRHAGLAWRPWRSAHSCADVDSKAHELLGRVGLSESADTPVAGLSHGQRRQLEIAMALAMDPLLILLDEPTAGMSAAETETFVDLVQSLESDVTLLLIEHDIDVVFEIATSVMVLTAGTCLIQGTPEEVRRSEAVEQAYFGGREVEELFTT
jgi:branched-chain amino acid transport system ATP-binding protein